MGSLILCLPILASVILQSHKGYRVCSWCVGNSFQQLLSGAFIYYIVVVGGVKNVQNWHLLPPLVAIFVPGNPFMCPNSIAILCPEIVERLLKNL
jgi:hypothetical protein